MAEEQPPQRRDARRAREDEKGFSELLPQIPPLAITAGLLDQLVLTINVAVNSGDSAQVIKQARSIKDPPTLLAVVAELTAIDQHAGALNNTGCALAFLDDLKGARQAFADARRAAQDWPVGQPTAKDEALANIAIVDGILARP